MCGLGGYAGVGSETLAWALGIELDARGGHAAGYVTDRTWATRVGPWEGARRRFVRKAGAGAVGIIHARYATCGTMKQRDAHPFEIRRNGRVALWGAHNGMIDDAEESALEHGREYTVDSRELFELIADGEYQTINKLSGYGVVSWIVPGERAVNLARLSDSGEMVVCSVAGGGYAWASTWEILSSALVAANLTAEKSFKLDVGQVYSIRPQGIFSTDETRCRVSRRLRSWLPRRWNFLTDEDYDGIIDAQKDDLFDLDGRDADDPRPTWLADNDTRRAWEEEDADSEEWRRYVKGLQ